MKVYIVAEMGNTHEGSIGLAKCMIKGVAECGVDAVKFQTHIFDAESLPDAPRPEYLKDESRKEYFDRTSFVPKNWKELKQFAENQCGVDFLLKCLKRNAGEKEIPKSDKDVYVVSE